MCISSVHDSVIRAIALRDLVSVRHGFVPGFGKAEGLRVFVLWRDEFGGIFFHADRPDFLGDAHLLE